MEAGSLPSCCEEEGFSNVKPEHTIINIYIVWEYLKYGNCWDQLLFWGITIGCMYLLRAYKYMEEGISVFPISGNNLIII